jgi:formyl-CoA transferase
VRLGEVANEDALPFGRPLDGVRILTLEQMQALPYATQLLARLGAEVVKIEPPRGDLGRTSMPAMQDPEGRSVGATFLRNNLDKRSVCVDLRRPEGRDLVLELARGFDVVAENSKPGSMSRLGLGPEDFAAVDERLVYVSVSGFGNTGDSPYREWPAFASITEAMSGIYTFTAGPGNRPRPNPVGALGDISAALFATIGVLAALRHRDRTGLGQHVDVAMLDSVVAMTDVVTNFWSLGHRPGDTSTVLLEAFRASDGWFVLQVGREQHFEALAGVVDRAEWLEDERLRSRTSWTEHLEDILRPAIEAWAAGRTRIEACAELSAAGLAAGPCATTDEVVDDPHVAARHMLVEFERPDGVAAPVLVPGNPVKMSRVAEGPERRPPWIGEHTDEVLAAELGLSADRIDELRTDGIVA